MGKKQLAVLLLCWLVNQTAGSGQLPLLPVYAVQLGAGAVFTGYYMAFALATLTAGTIIAGWLSDALQHRKALLIIAGIAIIPVSWSMGRVTSLPALGVLTAITWFLGGVQITLLPILAGLLADKSERGRVFGLLGMVGALGSLLGGLTMGSIVERWGYPALFAGIALWSAISPLAALLLEDKSVVQRRAGGESATGKLSALGGRFFLLVLSSLLLGVAQFVATLGRSLTMHSLGFLSAAISSTLVVEGAVSLPLPPLVGWLSDRLGRKRLLELSCLEGTASLFVLSLSTSLVHFWIAAALYPFLTNNVRGALGSALVADWIPRESLGVGMSLFQAMGWVGGIIGFTITGHAVEGLGIGPSFIIGAFLGVIAVVLLVPIRETPRGELAVG